MPTPKVTKPLPPPILTKSLENQYTLSHADPRLLLMEATDTLGDVEELINEVPEAVSKTAVDVVGLLLLLEEVVAASARQRTHECLSTTLPIPKQRHPSSRNPWS
jgi:predicted lysophospholipase L1 biosynthesis ABC-type transport system permease subunit